MEYDEANGFKFPIGDATGCTTIQEQEQCHTRAYNWWCPRHKNSASVLTVTLVMVRQWQGWMSLLPLLLLLLLLLLILHFLLLLSLIFSPPSPTSYSSPSPPSPFSPPSPHPSHPPPSPPSPMFYHSPSPPPSSPSYQPPSTSLSLPLLHLFEVWPQVKLQSSATIHLKCWRLKSHCEDEEGRHLVKIVANASWCSKVFEWQWNLKNFRSGLDLSSACTCMEWFSQ